MPTSANHAALAVLRQCCCALRALVLRSVQCRTSFLPVACCAPACVPTQEVADAINDAAAYGMSVIAVGLGKSDKARQ